MVVLRQGVRLLLLLLFELGGMALTYQSVLTPKWRRAGQVVVERAAGREARRLVEVVSDHGGRLADQGRLEADGQLEAAQFPVVAMADQYVPWVEIPGDQSADCVQEVERLEDLRVGFIFIFGFIIYLFFRGRHEALFG